MPVFLHVLFWSLGVLIVGAAAIVVIALWFLLFDGDLDAEISSAARNPDPTRANDKGSTFYRHAKGWALALVIGLTVVWVNLLALFIQIAVWIYS